MKNLQFRRNKTNYVDYNEAVSKMKEFVASSDTVADGEPLVAQYIESITPLVLKTIVGLVTIESGKKYVTILGESDKGLYWEEFPKS